jgi:hypothetical protein
MLKIITLIKREIYDHIAYFIGAIVLSLILITCIISAAYYSNSEGAPIFAIGLSTPVIVILIIGFTAIGVSQIYTDKNRRISAFLSTLPVTRDQILTARIFAGILAILTLFVPLTITTVILYQLLVPPVPIFKGLFIDMYTVTLLTALACYCIGLQTGWTTGKLLPILGGVVLACFFISIIIVKGFSSQASLILILFIIASLIRIRQKFISTSL